MHLFNFQMSQDNCCCPYCLQETNLPPPSWCPSGRAGLRTCVNACTLHPPVLWNWNLSPTLCVVPINNTPWRVAHSETVLGMPRLLQANIWVIVAFHVVSLAVLHVTSGFAKAYSPLEVPLAGCSLRRHQACHIQSHYSPPFQCRLYIRTVNGFTR